MNSIAYAIAYICLTDIMVLKSEYFLKTLSNTYYYGNENKKKNHCQIRRKTLQCVYFIFLKHVNLI